MKKQPEITERTRRQFINTFWSLAEKKPVSKINVSEITMHAGYNRSTFYEYFLNMDDLLSQIETELIEEIKQMMIPILTENSSLENVFLAIFTSMNEKIYLLMGSNGDSGFLPRIKSELVPIIVSYIPLPSDMPNFDYLISFVNSAMFGLLQHWNERNKNISAEEISTMMRNLVLHGLLTYLDS